MRINKIKNHVVIGANDRKTLIDIYHPISLTKLPIIIFIHGFKGYKDWGQFPMMLESVAAEGFCVLAMNISHNGGTIEQPIDFPDLEAFSKNTYSLEQEDIKRLVNWCLSEEGKKYLPNCDWSDINLWGHSRGGSMVILYVAKDNRINKVVSWAAVADLVKRLPEESVLLQWKKEGKLYSLNGRTKQQMPQLYSFVEDLLENQEQFSLKTASKKLKEKQLIIHGEKDETVGLGDAYLLKEWNPEATLKVIPSAAHTFGGKQPYDGESLPLPTSLAIDEMLLFIKG